MKTRNLFLFLSIFSIFLITSCTKDSENTDPGTMGITITQYGNTEDLNGDTLYLSSDYSFFGKALITSTNLTRVKYSVLYDGNEVSSTTYTPEPGGTGFLVDSIYFDIDYELFAFAMAHVTLNVQADRSDGQTIQGHFTFKMEPISNPFRFRFYDFNDRDTLAAGSSITIMPFYSPATVDDQIVSMKVYLKAGFGAESLVDTFGPTDFYYYQTGYLREYGYEVPSLPSGSGIVHRFELLTSKGRTHVIQHSIKLQ